MQWTTLLALLLGVVLYLVMGALVFHTLEISEEHKRFNHLRSTRNIFLHNHSCVTDEEFDRLVEIVSAVESGLDVANLPPNFTTRWDIPSGFFFCGTIITTIGFGNQSPQTAYGQFFCVVYALVGIPMFGILLAGVSDHMGTVLRRAVAKIETLFLKQKVRPTTVRVISAVLSILVGCLIFLATPTVVFQKMEDWAFVESLYFVVVTLTTVGFGDFVPGNGRVTKWMFKPLVWLWIVFGLAYFASILTMISNWLKVLSKKTRAEMEELRAHATDWTQNIQNMSMDFRIPNPLEFNDPFLLQRRRWKRSERRRIRRGAQGTLGYWGRAGENGHLPHRWVGLSSSMSQLEAQSSLERGARPRLQPRGSGGGVGAETDLRVGPQRKADAEAELPPESRAFPQLLSRSFSLPEARSLSELQSACVALRGDSLSGSESPFDYRSDASSVSSSFSAPLRFQSTTEDRGERTLVQTQDKLASQENGVSENFNSEFLQRSSPSLPPYAFQVDLPPYQPPRTPPSSDCQLLAFFGENLAYIDESSDTLSDRMQPRASEERRRRPRRPKKRSMRRQLPHKCSPLQARRTSSDLQPPSNPPTPPPDSLPGTLRQDAVSSRHGIMARESE
ncbi:potassium channel subfamily K member 10 isoform X2 [Synchiropus splendidus]|uniref:potassium channel subfamily K member 10 isoform X2 n=1 Tax=Synchiropus splendidus TaxID=270530 RepID=UPI00237D583D|nr:potassium channel subfamily K member 10 isoform X2 [Synchiropus splendidus]